MRQGPTDAAGKFKEMKPRIKIPTDRFDAIKGPSKGAGGQELNVARRHVKGATPEEAIGRRKETIAGNAQTSKRRGVV